MGMMRPIPMQGMNQGGGNKMPIINPNMQSMMGNMQNMPNMPNMGGNMPNMGNMPSIPSMGGNMPPMGNMGGNMGGNMPPMGGNIPPMGNMIGKGNPSDINTKISKFIKDRIQLETLSKEQNHFCQGIQTF